MLDDSGMSRRPRSVAGVALAAAGVMPGAAAATPLVSGPPLTAQQQIAFLNEQRAKHWLPADLVEVPEWSAACERHMAYLAATATPDNDSFGHDEIGPLATPLGQWGGANSVLVSGGDAFDAEGTNAFENAPVHLMQMLSPFVRRTGASGGCVVTQGDANPLGAPGTNTERVFSDQQTFSYPRNSARGVPPRVDSYEKPYVPAALFGLNTPGDLTRSTGTGPHLFFFYAGPGNSFGPQSWQSRGAITSASLTGPLGAVEIKTVDNTTRAPEGRSEPLGLMLAPGGILLPVAPLIPGSAYTASVTFDPNGANPVSRTWSFTTAGTAPAGLSSPGMAAIPPPTAPAPVPTITNLRLRKTSVAFRTSDAAPVVVTIERRTRKKRGTRPARWTTRQIRAIAAASGPNRLALRKLKRGTYRVRVRSESATGAVLVRKTFTL